MANTANNLPVRSPMYESADGSSADGGTLSRPWQNYFDQLNRTAQSAVAKNAVPFLRTLDIADTTVANNIAPQVVAQGAGQVTFLRAVLRKAISADLSMRVNVNGALFATLTIPLATLVGAVIASTPSPTLLIADADVLSWDITASDGSKDANGIASLSVMWAAP